MLVVPVDVPLKVWQPGEEVLERVVGGIELDADGGVVWIELSLVVLLFTQAQYLQEGVADGLEHERRERS